MGAGQGPIVFVSTMDADRWGGSEFLWSRTALRLAAKGVRVGVSIVRWSADNPALKELVRNKVDVQQRTARPPLATRVARNLVKTDRTWLAAQLATFLREQRPSLVIFSDGRLLPPLEVMRVCLDDGWPFATLSHSAPDDWWPADELVQDYRRALATARRCYFISAKQKALVERGLGTPLDNAQTVHNPYNVAFDAQLPWPSSGEGDALALACVGRLDATQKGQDLLLDVLARPPWTNRPWRLSFFGEGPTRDGLKAFARRLGLGERVVFAGHTSDLHRIWSGHHALVMPSRYEGLPIAIVEAMLCARPVVATDVGGVGELVEDGVTGFLAASATAGALADALERLWTKRAELESMGLAGAKRIRARVPADPVEVFATELVNLVSRL